MTRNAPNGSAQNSIGNKRQQDRDQRQLGRIERIQKKELVDDVHDDPEDQDSRGRNNSLPQPRPAALDAARDRRQVWRASEPRVVDAVAQRRDGRHRRLQNEAKGHRATGSSNNVTPHAIHLFSRNAVPEYAGGDEDNNQHDGYTRQNDRKLQQHKSSITTMFHHVTRLAPFWLQSLIEQALQAEFRRMVGDAAVVRSGSKKGMERCRLYVRFTPKATLILAPSRHCQRVCQNTF